VAHVADVRHQPERRRAIGARDDQRRAVEVVVLSGPAHTADTGIMCARFSVETMGWRTLA
jgi:hypothetical protein